MLDFQEQVRKAEIVWALTVAQRSFSFNSCNEIANVSRTMFLDSNIPKQFNIQSKKVSYALSYGLGSYFPQELVKYLKTNDKYF